MKHEPAFPITEASYPYTGLTIRDYFAAAALPMAAADGQIYDVTCEIAKRLNFTMPETFARMAYEIADAMIAERSKP